MKELEFHEVPYTVASYYIPAIINDDWSGLNDMDVLELTMFLDRNAPSGHYAWVVKAIDNEPELQRCEVSRMLATCEVLTLLTKVEPVQH